MWKLSARAKVKFYGVRMRIRGGRYGAVTIVVALCVVLAGCTTESSVGGGSGGTSSTPTSTPAFASEEEALAAAEEAYGAFLKMEDTIFADGGVEPERITPFATGDALQAALDGFASFEEQQIHSVGAQTFEITDIVRYSPAAIDGEQIVDAYVCLDISEVDVLDADAKSVVDENRPPQQPFEVSFVWSAASDGLVVGERDVWTGGGVCD